MIKIYVATSWKNKSQHEVVLLLRAHGYEVYDFADSEGFHWSEVDKNYTNWLSDPLNYLKGLEHERAIQGFNRDMGALKNCDVCLYVMPCGISASMELGWAVGAGKYTIVYIPELREPDLMVKMADLITVSFSEVLQEIAYYAKTKNLGS